MPASIRLVARTMDTTKASRHHAVTSSTAAQVMLMTPTFDWSSPRSLRMRASTGKAVMLIATPMKSTNDRKGTSGDDRAR
jgi:hypothetical protein